MSFVLFIYFFGQLILTFLINSYNRFILQSCVLGDSRQSYCLALVIPDPEFLLPWAKSQNLPDSDSLPALCKNQAVKDMLLKSIKDQAKAGGLFGFETPRKIFLSPEPMTPENGLLTPTLKTKRHYVKKVFAKEIEECYA